MAALPEVWSRNVSVEGRTYTVRPPQWGMWQVALDAGLGAGPAPELDAAALLELCLAPCVYGPDGPLSLVELRRLPAAAGDALLTAALELLENERERLDLGRSSGPDGVVLSGAGLRLRLRPWSFGERNRALGACLRLVDGEPRVDLGAYELTMVCVGAVALDADGTARSLNPAEVAQWPVPLGEATVQALDELNGVDPNRDAVLQACLQRGLAHPDLTLLQLCRTFGWTPQTVEGLEAQHAERLLAALRALEAPPMTAAQPAAAGEEVTRIVVAPD